MIWEASTAELDVFPRTFNGSVANSIINQPLRGARDFQAAREQDLSFDLQFGRQHVPIHLNNEGDACNRDTRADL